MAVSAVEVKALRERMGWTQYDLADRIGCNQSTVCRIEAGEKVGGVIGKVLYRLIEENPQDRAAAA